MVSLYLTTVAGYYTLEGRCPNCGNRLTMWAGRKKTDCGRCLHRIYLRDET